MIVRRCLLPTLCCLTLALASRAAAQEEIKSEKKGETKQEVLKKILAKAEEEYRTFFKEPKTALEFWAALTFEVQVGKFDIAALHLDKMLKLPEKERDEDLLKIEDAEGFNPFLRLREIREWTKHPELNAEAKKNVEMLIDIVLEAAKRKLSDQERLSKFIEGLFDPVPEVRGFSLLQIKRSQHYAAALLADKLRHSKPSEQQKLKQYLLELDPDIMPPMLELLRARDAKDAADLEFRLNLLWLFKVRHEKRAIPYLWHLSAAPQYPKLLRDQARETLAYLLDTNPNTLPPAKVALVQLAEKYYLHRVRYPDITQVADRDNPAKLLVMPGYKLWPVTDAGKITEKWVELKPDAARMAFGMRYALQALELDKAYLPAQAVYLSFLLEDQFSSDPYKGQLDKLVTERRPAALQQLLAKIDVDLLATVLERALKEGNYPLILPLIDALSERGEVRLAMPSGGGAPGPLVRALYYPDRRVQYAATRAMLRLPTTPAPVASTRIVEILGRFLRTDPAPKVLFLYAQDERATALRMAAKEAGFESEVALNIKEGMKLLHRTADYDAVIVDSGVPDADLTFVLSQLRADSDAGMLPVLLVAVAAKKSDLERTAERTKNAFIISDLLVTKGAELKPALEDAIKFAAAPEAVRNAPDEQQPWLKYEVRRAKGQTVSATERKQFAKESLDWFAQMARGELTGYDLAPAKDALVQALNNKDQSVQALYILARFPGGEAQQRLAGILFDADKKHLHGIAARELNRHIQKNGLVLTDDQINVLRAMEQAKDVPPEIRVELAVLVGTLRATAQQTGTRLLNYVPDVPAPVKEEK